jgi:hypothetical protein
MMFQKLTKLAVGPLAILMLTGANFKGDRLSVVFPDGWSPPETGADGLTQSFESKPGPNCNTQTKDLPGLAKATLAQINADTGHAFSAAEWADFLGYPATSITVVDSEIRPFADAYFHVGTLRIKTDQGADVMMRHGFYVLPGRITMTGCYAEPANFDSKYAVFDRVVNSLRPW